MPGMKLKAATMSLRSLEYAVKESFCGIHRNSLMSIASITTMGLALCVLGGFVLLTLGLVNGAQNQLNKFEISVFLDGRLSDDNIIKLKSDIQSLPHVKSAKLIPADIAWSEFKEDFGKQIDLEGVNKNPLPDTFTVRVDDPKHTSRIAVAIKKLAHVDEVSECTKELEQVMRLSRIIKFVGGLSTGVLFLITVFIVSNTIRLTVYARRREIKIMQMVGATNWFIELPFVLEGIILGAIGGGVACLLIFGGSRYITDVTTRIMPLLKQFSSDLNPIQLFGSLVALGCLIGAAGSFISLRRFLKA